MPSYSQLSSDDENVSPAPQRRGGGAAKKAGGRRPPTPGSATPCETIRKRAKRQLGDVQTAKHGSAPMQQLLQVAATIAAQVEGAADDDSQLA